MVNKKKGRQTFLVPYLGMSIDTGVGADILGGMGGSVGMLGAKGLTNFSKSFPTVGTLGGYGLVLKQLQKLNKRKRY